MKTIKTILKSGLVAALALVMLFGVVACSDITNDGKVAIKLSADKTELSYGESAILSVEITGTDDDTYTLDYDDSLIEITGTTVSLVKDVDEQKSVKIYAVANADQTAISFITITLIPLDDVVNLSANIGKSEIHYGETANISVTVTGLEDRTYTFDYDTSIISISEKNVISVVENVTEEKEVTITVIANADETLTKTLTIKVVPVFEMQILAETTEMDFETNATLELQVVVPGISNPEYTWSIDKTDLVSIENNVLSFNDGVNLLYDQTFTVTATLVSDPTVSAFITITAKAPVIEGQVYELTTAMIQELGNSSITVSGVLTDYYQDFNQSYNNAVNKYDMTVQMSEGKWTGSWNVHGSSNVITTSYRMGEETGTDSYGNKGHVLQEAYISKYNEVTYATVKDYMSVPAIWEAQHLWNHISSLANDIEHKFTYDSENEVYAYKYDVTNEQDAYLMTYLAYSLTPLLEDTLNELYFVVENGAITKMLAQTEILYYGADTSEDASAMSYTTIELTFTNIGTTEVAEPQPYEAPSNADVLTAALAKMQNATSYEYQLVDTTTYSPSYDDSDYTIESVTSGSSAVVALSDEVEEEDTNVVKPTLGNNTSATGTVGQHGWVTEDAVLVARTGQYQYTLDDKTYWTQYTGYRQFTDEDGNPYYEEFAFDTTNGVYYGTRRYSGTFADSMPSFDFSANVFKLTGSQTSETTGRTLYTFTLRETAITRDIALEVSNYSYATSASAGSASNVTIVVDENGNLISTTYPYSLVSGTYLGYCTTTYSNINSTVLPDENLFAGYIAREVKTTWSQYTMKYFSETFSTLDSHEENAQYAIDYIFGEYADQLISPADLLEIFDDNLSGPFYDFNSKGTDSEGNDIYYSSFSFTATGREYDENYKITNYEEVAQDIDTVLTNAGYAMDNANTGISGGNTNLTYISNNGQGDVMIRIENNGTRYFWIYFYKVGDWTLNRG